MKRLASIGWLTCAIAVTACGPTGTSRPGAPAATTTPRPYFTTGEQLAAFATQRRSALHSLAAAKPTDVAWGSMTMARPLDPAELRVMMSDAGIDSDYYYEWIEAGTGVSGGGGAMQMVSQLESFPGLRITYVKAKAMLASLAELSRDDRVWLIDVGGTENYYDLAQSSGLTR